MLRNFYSNPLIRIQNLRQIEPLKKSFLFAVGEKLLKCERYLFGVRTIIAHQNVDVPNTVGELIDKNAKITCQFAKVVFRILTFAPTIFGFLAIRLVEKQNKKALAQSLIKIHEKSLDKDQSIISCEALSQKIDQLIGFDEHKNLVIQNYFNHPNGIEVDSEFVQIMEKKFNIDVFGLSELNAKQIEEVLLKYPGNPSTIFSRIPGKKIALLINELELPNLFALLKIYKNSKGQNSTIFKNLIFLKVNFINQKKLFNFLQRNDEMRKLLFVQLKSNFENKKLNVCDIQSLISLLHAEKSESRIQEILTILNSIDKKLIIAFLSTDSNESLAWIKIATLTDLVKFVRENKHELTANVLNSIILRLKSVESELFVFEEQMNEFKFEEAVIEPSNVISKLFEHLKNDPTNRQTFLLNLYISRKMICKCLVTQFNLRAEVLIPVFLKQFQSLFADLLPLLSANQINDFLIKIKQIDENEKEILDLIRENSEKTEEIKEEISSEESKSETSFAENIQNYCLEVENLVNKNMTPQHAITTALNQYTSSENVIAIVQNAAKIFDDLSKKRLMRPDSLKTTIKQALLSKVNDLLLSSHFLDLQQISQLCVVLDQSEFFKSQNLLKEVFIDKFILLLSEKEDAENLKRLEHYSKIFEMLPAFQGFITQDIHNKYLNFFEAAPNNEIEKISITYDHQLIEKVVSFYNDKHKDKISSDEFVRLCQSIYTHLNSYLPHFEEYLITLLPLVEKINIQVLETICRLYPDNRDAFIKIYAQKLFQAENVVSQYQILEFCHYLDANEISVHFIQNAVIEQIANLNNEFNNKSLETLSELFPKANFTITKRLFDALIASQEKFKEENMTVRLIEIEKYLEKLSQEDRRKYEDEFLSLHNKICISHTNKGLKQQLIGGTVSIHMNNIASLIQIAGYETIIVPDTEKDDEIKLKIYKEELRQLILDQLRNLGFDLNSKLQELYDKTENEPDNQLAQLELETYLEVLSEHSIN